MREFLTKPIFKMMSSYKSYQNCSLTCNDIGWNMIGVSLIYARLDDLYFIQKQEISILKTIFKPLYESWFDRTILMLKYGNDDKISKIFNDLIDSRSKGSRFVFDPTTLERITEYGMHFATEPGFHRFYVEASMNTNLRKLYY